MRNVLSLLALAAALALGACDSDPTGSGSVYGTYTLQTANGLPLPAAIEEGPDFTLEVVTGTVALATDNSFDATILLRETAGGEVTTTALSSTGTFQHSDNAVVFTATGGAQWVGALGGATLAYDLDNAIVLVFRRD